MGDFFLGVFWGIIFGGKSWGNYFFETKGPGPRTLWARGYQERIRSVSGYPGPADAGRVRAGPGPDRARTGLDRAWTGSAIVLGPWPWPMAHGPGPLGPFISMYMCRQKNTQLGMQLGLWQLQHRSQQGTTLPQATKAQGPYTGWRKAWRTEIVRLFQLKFVFFLGETLGELFLGENLGELLFGENRGGYFSANMGI